MRKMYFLTGILFLMSVSLWAQMPVRQSVKIDIAQVPLAVRHAFERDFGAIPEDGFWTVNITRTQQDARVVTTPQWYSFNKKEKKMKREVRFSPEGEVLYVKGFDKNLETPSGEEISIKEKLG